MIVRADSHRFGTNGLSELDAKSPALRTTFAGWGPRI